MPVSHHGTVQGDRSLAQPLVTKVRISAKAAEGELPLGFVGTTEVPLHASSRLSFAQQKAEQKVEFTAPYAPALPLLRASGSTHSEALSLLSSTYSAVLTWLHGHGHVVVVVSCIPPALPL